MGNKAIPSFPALWEAHERIYLDVFRGGLEELAEKYMEVSLPGNENELSRQLAIILSQICFRWSKSKDREIRKPYWELPKQPTNEEDPLDPKRPDFTCDLVNPLAYSAADHHVSFHVECKLLGTRTSSSWILNENYILHGIMRFDIETHRYGEGAPSGLMIGYMINMSTNEIEDEVNRYYRQRLPDHGDLRFEKQSKADRVTACRKNFQRTAVKPADFSMQHFWVELFNVVPST